MLTAEQILALAPDAGSAKAARDLAVARKWLSLGREAQVAWGECQGSGKDPYRTQIDLSEPAFRCNCPSRKFPCKHGLGLFLLLANQPSEFAQAAPPDWVAEWLASRAKRAEQAAEGKKAKQVAMPDGAAKRTTSTSQHRQAAQREKRVREGLDELALWFRDLMRHGLASVQAQPVRTWEARAARLVDAQAPGVARLLREMSGIPYTGPGWPERLLERIGRAHLLIESFQRLDSLPPETQADIRASIGWTQSQEELLAGAGVRDRWLVLAQSVTEEDRLRAQRTWLWGHETGRAALILQFAPGKQPFPTGPVPGTRLDAELVFYPGSYPQRALVKQRYAAPEPIDNAGIEGVRGSGILPALQSYGDVLALDPWLERFPMLLQNVVPERQDTGWAIRDEAGHVLPVRPEFDKNWGLLALSGGHPVAIFGEWDGQTFMPLSVFAYRFVHLAGDRGSGIGDRGGGQTQSPSPDPQSSAADSTLWLEMVNSALLGTERRPLDLPPDGTPLGEALSQLKGGDPEHALLGAAAALSLYRRAGHLPSVDGRPLPEPCPPEDLPLCSARASEHFATLLHGTHADEMLEWLVAAASLRSEARQVARPESLPALLDVGRNTGSPPGRGELRDAVLAVIGKRGRWLAARNPGWGYVAGADDDEGVWETGDRAARFLFLERLRARHPARARELVGATWEQESADDRTAKLVTFRVGLSMDDEPFLEERLDDRSKEVREQAADLLSHLPDSRYVRRMIEGVLPLLDLKKVRQKGWLPGSGADASYIQVSLAQDYTPAMKRDGIQKKPTDPRMGERAYWLSQMLARIPPKFWVEKWGTDAGNIISAGMRTKDWNSVLVGAWAEATQRYQDAAWAEAFLGDKSADLVTSPAGDLLWILPPNKREAFVLNILRGNASALFTKAMPEEMLLQLEAPWSMALSRVVLKGLSHYIGPVSNYGNWQARQSLKLLARTMPPSIRNEAVSLLSEKAATNTFFTEAVDDFLTTLEFRQEMLKEFAP